MSEEDAAAQPEQGEGPVRRWTVGTLVVILVLVVWYLASDRWTPSTAQARLEAFVVPIAPQVSSTLR